MVQAQRVFDALRTFDTSDVTEIFAQCPDNRGLGLAIGNRLKKAAGFHVVEADSERVVLGLTGGTGAGKSSALRAIRSLGGEVIDCDALYHEMLETCAPLRDEIGVSFPGAFDAAGPTGPAPSWDRRSSPTRTGWSSSTALWPAIWCRRCGGAWQRRRARSSPSMPSTC